MDKNLTQLCLIWQNKEITCLVTAKYIFCTKKKGLCYPYKRKSYFYNYSNYFISFHWLQSELTLLSKFNTKIRKFTKTLPMLTFLSIFKLYVFEKSIFVHQPRTENKLFNFPKKVFWMEYMFFLPNTLSFFLPYSKKKNVGRFCLCNCVGNKTTRIKN